jgi:hypothetical protein
VAGTHAVRGARVVQGQGIGASLGYASALEGQLNDDGMHERVARRAAAFVVGAAPCLRFEVRAGVNTSVRRPTSVGALTQGRDRWAER